jgi:hypothetical protein
LRRKDEVITVREDYVGNRNFRSVGSQTTEFSRTYWNVLPQSDFNCLYRLIQRGKIEVVVDTSDGAVTLLPQKEWEPFVDKVFEALREDHEQGVFHFGHAA